MNQKSSISIRLIIIILEMLKTLYKIKRCNQISRLIKDLLIYLIQEIPNKNNNFLLVKKILKISFILIQFNSNLNRH